MIRARPAFWIVGVTLSLFLFAAAAPSPLYGVYAARWHFSAIALTEVFAIYALALLVTLLLTGSLSDAIGRRWVILGALALQLLSLVLFIGATNVWWLYAARITQGIATGAATSALAAALVDLQPSDRPNRAALVNSVAPAVGLASGAMVSALVVQYGPDQLHDIYWLMLGAFVLAVAGAILIVEPSAARKKVSLVPKIGVEPAARGAFAAALPSLVTGWAVASFYLSLGPSLAIQLSGGTNRISGGLAIFLLAGVGAVSILALGSWPPRRAMSVGAAFLLAGLAMAALAVALRSLTFFLGGTAIAGIGFGLSWLGVLRTLIGLASPTGRGALIATIYIVSYLAFALPAVVAGWMVTLVGLHEAALWYAVAMGVLALFGLAGSLLVRPGSPIVRPA